jgi:predicted aspartyl protease
MRPVPSASIPVAPARPGAVAVKGYDTVIDFRPGQPIYVVARLNNVEIARLILDTGADRTVVAPLPLWRLGISTRNVPRGEITGVTGATAADMVRVNSVEVGAARVGPLTIVAHDTDFKNADGLLGRDFLDQFTLTIDGKAGVVTLAPN